MATHALLITQVDTEGRVIHLDPAAEALLGPCRGYECSAAVAARGPNGRRVCTATCHQELLSGDQRCGGEVVVRGQHMQLTCTRIEGGVVVALQPCHDVDQWTERLTARERQVMQLVARGYTGTEIARMLDIRPSTVRTHVEHARSRLMATTRAEAVARAITTGQID